MNHPASSPNARSEAGFTLLEALVAMALLAFVVISFLGTRTDALVDSVYARNWRVARTIAERELSIIMAGAHELPPENKRVTEVGEDFPNFRFKILIGDAAISEAEADIASLAAGGDDEQNENKQLRLEWQRDRDRLRRAQSSGVSFSDYEVQLLEEELEERIPSEDEFEDVAVVVYFPNVAARDEDDPAESAFMLRATVSTMAIEGLTPEEAELAREREQIGTSTPSGESGSSR